MNDEKIVSEVEEARKEIKTDQLQMSVGELLNLYKEKELKLNPTYQRLFRWKDEDKTRFIESLILGIPVPPIFVAQSDEGIWDIVDGLQRISTILQLTGDLEGSESLTLTSCNYIPSIEGNTWETLPSTITRVIKRSRLSISIILTENSIKSQYELFQRLNTGGMHLSDQEIRNCLIIMSDSDFYETLNSYKENESLLGAINQKESKLKEEISMELMLRYLIAKKKTYKEEEYNVSKTLFSRFIDNETLNLIKDPDFNIAEELALLVEVIDKIHMATGNNTFVKYNFGKARFEGGFSLSVFEAVLSGIANNWDNIKNIPNNELRELIISLNSKTEFKTATKAGTKALKRYFLLNNLSSNYFSAL